MAKFLKSKGTYLRVEDIESIKEVSHLGAKIVHVITKSGHAHVMPTGVPAKFIMEMLIQGDVLDVQEEFSLASEGI